MTKETIIALCKKYLKDFPVDNITFEIDPKCVREKEHGWRVLLTPSHLPERMTYYYEELAIVEEDLSEKENINILFSTGDPANLLAEVA